MTSIEGRCRWMTRPLRGGVADLKMAMDANVARRGRYIVPVAEISSPAVVCINNSDAFGPSEVVENWRRDKLRVWMELRTCPTLG